jgi:DNA repair exonuclease SbcCD nuclease subunit
MRMKKLLSFSDVHLGIRTHSVQQSSGLFDAELEGRIALDEVYERACQDDIFAIICAGDVFHSSHPTTENIKFFISWLRKMDSIGKLFIIILGNHDEGIHSNSMIFIHELNFKNIILIDSKNPPKKDFYFGNWNIIFAPYIISDSSKDRECATYDLIDSRIKASCGKTILVTHIHEHEAKIGSEGIMLARKVPHINFENYIVECDIILLTGHIHRHQVYIKNNGIKVVYPGSLFYHDKHDVNQDKGYVLINEDGEIEFETLKNIRKFVSYKVPEDGNVIDFLKRFRLGSNKYIFLNIESEERLDERPIREFLKTQNCKLGGIFYKTKDMEFNTEINIDCVETDPYIAFNNYLDNVAKVENIKYLEDIKLYSEECIAEVKGL